MSFSTLVSDLAFRDSDPEERKHASRNSPMSRAASYARSSTSTTATSVSISGDISSQLHGGYSHPLTRSWQAERQLTKVHFAGSLIDCIRLILRQSLCSYTRFLFPTKTTKNLQSLLFPINTVAGSANSFRTSNLLQRKVSAPSSSSVYL